MPVHVPGSAVSVSPTCSSPVIVGGTVLTGGAGTTVGALAELSLPASFVAVTTTTTAWPWSSSVTVYVGSVAPSMSTQSVPSSSQRCHW